MDMSRVAPLAGAWIEIFRIDGNVKEKFVAPLAGAWIEICTSKTTLSSSFSSLPSRERGLKLPIRQENRWRDTVAPLAGAWIEIIQKKNWKI